MQLLAFESFGKDWATDVAKQLKIAHEVLSAPYGELPDTSKVKPDADLVFTWNGTTSGVRVPNADFIARAAPGSRSATPPAPASRRRSTGRSSM